MRASTSQRTSSGHASPRARVARSRGTRRWPHLTPPRPRARGVAHALDGGVVTSISLLGGIGIVMVYSTTAPLAMEAPIPPHFARHLGATLLGAGLVALCLRVPLATWRRLALPLWGAGLVLLALTLVVGVRVNAAERWLDVPGLGVRFQPAELVKWATALAVASELARDRIRGVPARRRIQHAVLLAAIPAALLLRQPDLGSAGVLVVLVALLLFAAGAPLRRLAVPGALAGAGGALFVLLHPYARRRVAGFLDPWERAQNEGFQLVQSFVAFGRGGLGGVGLGDGRQKLGYLPEAHTDFVLAALAEELGLVGVIAVIAAFAALTVAGTRIAARARDPFAMLVALGMTACVVTPALVNAAVVMGLVPTTGFTLPFLSYGRSALLFCALAVGVLLRVGSCEAPPPRSRVPAAAGAAAGAKA